MSFWNCVEDAADEGSIDRDRAKQAQAMFVELTDRYMKQGHGRGDAEAMAAEDVKAAFKKKAGEDRHIALAKLSSMRELHARAGRAQKPDMVATLETLENRRRGLVRRFHGRLGAFLKQNGRDLLGNLKDPAALADIVRELHGEATGKASARLMADGIRATLEDMRIMFNEAGGLVGKLEDWGLPHQHNRAAIRKAGFDAWFAEISPRINWTRMEDRLTGRPFQSEGGDVPPLDVQRQVLAEAYDNIVFGREVDNPTYGRPKGVATYRKHSESRVLHFNKADDWMEYNRLFGTGDAFKSLMGHVHRMSRDITLMREFGPNPGLGAEYYGDLLKQKFQGKGKETLFDKATGDVNVGLRMFRVISGGAQSDTARQDWIATAMSSLRHVLTAAQLDRAVVASMSDINSVRLAAQSMKMNPTNVVAKMTGALQSLSKEDLARAGWVADTMADAGTVLARFQNEVAPLDIAERLSSAAMRVQGLSAWTDRARAIFFQEMAGYMASQADRPFDMLDEPLKRILAKNGVTPEDWAHFTAPEAMFRAGNGATFAFPMYWREATTLPRADADRIFDRVMGAMEEELELAVPTGSILARGFTDPAAYDLPPGSIGYEVMKSATMYKPFAMTFTINQYRQIMARPTIAGRIGYGLNLAAGATVMGAIAIQANELLLGRDPQDMTNPGFIVRAAMKGGAFGILGDIASTGAASWGGGYSAYIAGPVAGVAQDVYDLTFKNAAAMMMGEDANFASDLARFGKRYTPMGQTPLIGPALDRLFWDQLQIFLDPDSADALAKNQKRTDNLNGRGTFWMPGDLAPSRGPDLANAFGG